MLDVHEYSEFPPFGRGMAFELMIRCGLHSSAELVPIDVQSLAPCATCVHTGGPRTNFKIDEYQAFCVEEKKKLIQPVDHLRSFVLARRFEVSFFNRAESGRINKNAYQAT